jgi:L-threonate 2-dehydrogenase
MTRTVGIIGLGIMGGAMARNMAAGGLAVIGFDVDAAACDRARAAGARLAGSATEVAEAAAELIVSLPSAHAVLETARSIAASKGKARTVAETSTLAIKDKVAFAQILADAGHVALDCPLSGTGAQAQTKDLVVFASGDAAAIQTMEPVFLGFARKVHAVGAYGAGSKMKYVANLLVAIHNIASAEAMVLGMKAGLDPHQIVEVVSSGAGTSRVFELRAPMMAENHYLPATMKSRIWRKDMAVIGDFAQSIDCPTPLFDATGAIYDAALAMGHDASDVAVACRVLETMAVLKR